MKNTFIVIVICFLLIGIGAFIGFMPFATGVVNDGKRMRELSKSPMVRLSFKGKIVSLNSQYLRNPSITLIFKKSENLPEFYARQRSPYYIFEGTDTLIVNVSEHLLNSVNPGDSVMKPTGSNRLFIKDKKSWKEFPWLEKWE